MKVCETHGDVHGDISNRECINCGRVCCSVCRPSWQCDLCWKAVQRALAGRKKTEAKRREARKP